MNLLKSKGDWMICPGELKYPKLHRKLEKAIEKLNQGKHSRKEIRELKKEIKEMRSKFYGIKPLRE